MVVYLIECKLNDGLTYKIGKTSRNGNTRLAELSTGNAGQMRLVCEYESKNSSLIESALHLQYSHKRLSGEWFSADITPNEFLNSCKKIDENIQKLRELENPFL